MYLNIVHMTPNHSKPLKQDKITQVVDWLYNNNNTQVHFISIKTS